MFRTNPTTNPFGAVGSLLGFAQQLTAGSDVGTITNSVILSPTVTWEQHVGFTRLRAYAGTGQDFDPTQLGMSLLGSHTFPQFGITTADATVAKGLEFGPSTSFGNAGMYQNQWEFESSLNMVKSRHTIAIGGQFDRTQLNVINNNTSASTADFTNFETFVEGKLHGGDAFSGSASRYYRSDTAGVYINDNYKVRSNLTVTAGVRWDFDGPLSEKYGRLTGFNPKLYSYDAASDTLTGSGLEFAANNSGGRHSRGQQFFDDQPPVGLRAAARHRLVAHFQTNRARRLRHLLRSRRTLQLLLPQRRLGLQRSIWRDISAAFR